MRLWRIASETRQYTATDLSGLGAAKRPGRWNDDGEAVVYAAQTPALAVLETAAHADRAGLPGNRYLVEISVPQRLWNRRKEIDVARLPVGWDAIPEGEATVRIGSAWLKSGSSLIMTVPSAIVEEERVVLINPAHLDATKLEAKALRRFFYQLLFRN